MLRNAAWVLRQRRYAALAVFMIALAGFCASAGTWQVSRYTQKVRDNDALRANAHDPARPLTPALVPLAGSAPAPNAEQIRYRTVTASGTYLVHAQQYLRNQTVGDTDGYLVVTPLRTAGGVLLVARGFVAPANDGGPPAGVAAPPTGTVRVVGRMQTASTSPDHAAVLPQHMIDTVDPAAQATRLRVPVYDGYLVLDPGSPGGSGLQSLPPPDLSNPAGGAAEWQHLAYIVQWYIFAGLALAAPFAVCAHEVREARRRFLGIDPDAEQFDAIGADELLALPGGSEDASGSGPSSELALRVAAGSLAVRAGAPTAAQWQRAARLADRYGRSLGRDTPAFDASPAVRPPVRLGKGAGTGPGLRPVTSATAPARAIDDYHGAYNDYLWQLALADGNIPDISLPGSAAQPDRDEGPLELPEPRVIDVEGTRDGEQFT
ncbi:MAG: SURF1 family protein [Jatrophihabitans sp.]|nr:MAG: SURF1 family protein [Jatrophihabitans sp.]